VKKNLPRILLGLVLLAVFLGHAAKLWPLDLVDRLEHILYDTRLRLTMPGGVDDRIVILDIDEKSLADPALGRWPWGRDKTAALVEKLFERHGVALIAFDVVNAEPDTSSGLPVLQRLAEGPLKEIREFQDAFGTLRSGLDHDAIFARAIKSRPVVLGYYFTDFEEAQTIGVLPAPVLPAGTFSGRSIPFYPWRGFGGNLKEFQGAAAGSGHFNSVPDTDGVTRRVPMLVEYKGAYYESLSLAVVRTLLGFPPVVPGYPPERFMSRSYQGLEWLEVGPLRVPVDENVAALVPYRGPPRSFAYVSLADVWHDRVPAGKLKGRIALVGTSAPALVDLRATPVGEVYPGVEVHANLIAGILDKSVKQRPAYTLGAEITLLVVTGVLLAFLVPFLTPLQATLVSLATLAGYTALNVAVWSSAGLVLPLASGLLMIGAMFALNMSYGYFVESRSKRQFTELFGQYVPPELVDKMALDPRKYTMDGRSETLTVLFADIRGFTAISETLEPRALAQFINEYLTTMSLAIRSRRGTLDKYIGDAIMAFWGAPVADALHARQAVETALAMHAELAKLNAQFRAQGWPEIRIGVGVNTGTMSVGDMGSKLRKAYTVMGDAVNLASRLEGVTKQYGLGILVGEDTRKAVQDVVFREVDLVRVKGKDRPVAIFEPLGFEGQVAKDTLDQLRLWQQALKLYRAQNWDQAELALFNLQRMAPQDELYAVYARRVAALRAAPPGPGWDGVTNFETK
jgi:adenylate cyclase